MGLATTHSFHCNCTEVHIWIGKVDYPFCDVLTQTFQQLATVIGVAIPSDTDTSIPLCGRDCVQLVNHIPLESVRAYGHFLTNLIKAELKEIQRGVIYSALREVQLPSPTEKTLQSVKEVLSSVCSANLAKDVSSVGLIKGQSKRYFVHTVS